MSARFTFYEFFAGGGMARIGLGPKWRCLLANDIDPKKAACYARNFGSQELLVADVASLTPQLVRERADLAWASFPCQDLSLAGNGAGLSGRRSGTFWPFWDLVRALGKDGRAPRMIVLENVCGMLRSHGGRDFAAVGSALADGGYRFGCLVIDAARFLPQSRPRLFIVGIRADAILPREVAAACSQPAWTSRALLEAHQILPEEIRKNWIWWSLPEPKGRVPRFADLIEEHPTGVRWHSPRETQRILGLMSDVNLAKVRVVKRLRTRVVGTVYKRTRTDDNGRKQQRAEVRFDDIAGCLRTPAGGSSRQTILVVEGESVRSRLLSPREAARLMGLHEEYVLPENYNDAYHIAGDGLAVPVVRHLSRHVLEPVLAAQEQTPEVAA